MREIKFRGKRKDIGWKYGYLTMIENAGSSIFPHNQIAIRPLDEKYITYGVEEESVGQYTGLKDKQDKEIYEGDIINAGVWGVVGYYDEDKFIIEFSKGAFRGFRVKYFKKKDRFSFSVPLYKLETIEVIGNIYENLMSSGR